jgi:Ni/Fe-hydrogenase 1 B-type cytochrome subunit
VFHVSFGWTATALFTFRLVDMLVRKDKSLLLSWQSFKDVPKVFAYYFYLRPNLPPHTHYNPGQKLVFTSWLLLFPFIFFISFASYINGSRLDWVIKLAGGLQTIRMLKFMGAIYFASTIILHIYLSLTEDLSRLQSMVTGLEHKPPENKIK